ncbi:MAG: hypothetical protein K2J77_08595 [Oscillospiraceae bacterium]|nr:hypothetical protein [Oscillospiraceae bacterium]
MTELNALLEAMNNIDENIVSDIISENHKSPRRFKTLFIAAAALLMMITGAAVVYNRYPKSMTINGEPMFKYNYVIMESVTPFSREQMLARGAEIIRDEEGFTGYRITALPSEIFTAFKMPSRINDNFIEEETEIKAYYSYKYKQPEEVTAIRLLFSLVDKNTGNSVDFGVDCARSEEHVLGGLEIVSLHQVDGKTHYEDFDKELLTLNDGSQAIVYKWGPNEKWYASFAYDGLVYTDVSVNSSDYDDMITVLADLGVL